jgi:hypothetical protein
LTEGKNLTGSKREKYMKLKVLGHDLSVCKVADTKAIDLSRDFYFIGRTDEEVSLVCITADAPDADDSGTLEREDGWKGFRIEGVLDFGLIGILSKISGCLADAGIGIFAVSTYNTDYVLVKEENYENALSALAAAGYEIER